MIKPTVYGLETYPVTLAEGAVETATPCPCGAHEARLWRLSTLAAETPRTDGLEVAQCRVCLRRFLIARHREIGGAA